MIDFCCFIMGYNLGVKLTVLLILIAFYTFCCSSQFAVSVCYNVGGYKAFVLSSFCIGKKLLLK